VAGITKWKFLSLFYKGGKNVKKIFFFTSIILLVLSSLCGWTLTLKGVREETVTQSYFESMKGHLTHYIEIGVDDKNETVRYRAMPLWLLIAMIDGKDSTHPYEFDLARWEAGYEVTLISSDGYAVTFDSAEMPVGQLYLADIRNGEAIPPTIVGNVAKKYIIKDIATIEIMLPELMTEQKSPYSYILECEIGGEVYTYTLQELKDSRYFIEKPGQYTTSAGTTYGAVYGGVRIYDFLSQLTDLATDDTLKLVALDGYEMSYPIEKIADSSEGTWIFAFISDGVPMIEEPGPVRTIKVGDMNPNIDGHLSAKMVKRVILAGKPFKPYTLSMKGLMDAELDRQTIESGVSCHKTTVQYRSKSAVNAYTGIALWRLLAFCDDPELAPHKQDSSILSYNGTLAQNGYQVKITAADGYSITLDSKDLDRNDTVILATLKNGEELPEGEWPMIIVWQSDSPNTPKGIKSVKQVASIEVIIE
jgi:hypothetical protein